MQTQVAPTAPVVAQTPPIPPVPTISVPGVGVISGSGVPTTATEVRALKAKRAELSTQLESAASRRARLSRSLEGKEGADRAGIEARISVLDKRILQLESDMAETGRQLTMAPSALVASTGSSIQFGRGMDSSVAPVLFVLLVLAPIALSAARFMWKRALAPTRPAASPDESRRLERLEQGVDAIAIEVERISEGQRFVTRLLSEAHDGAAIPVTQRIGEGARLGEDAGDEAQRART